MKTNNNLRILSAFAFILSAIIFTVIIAMPSSISFASTEDRIEYNNSYYNGIDNEYIDSDDNIKTFSRTYQIEADDTNARILSALHMPKGRYAKMSIQYDLVKLMIDDAFSQSSFRLDRYEAKDGANILISQEEYFVEGYNFLSQLEGTYFNVATIDDPYGKYNAGDYYNDVNSSDVYTLQNLINNRLSKYVLDDLTSTYTVGAKLRFYKYYTIKSEYINDVEQEDQTIKVALKINFNNIKLDAVENGDVFTATGEYEYTNELTKDSVVGLSYVNFSVNEEAFDKDNGGYDVTLNTNTNLPMGATLKYVIDNSVVVDTNTNYVILSSFPEQAYTIKGILTFITNDLQQITLESNILTIQNHSFEIRTNNIYSTNVKVNEDYLYALSADRGKTQLSSFSDAHYVWSFNYDKINTSQITQIKSQNPSYGYKIEGNKITYVEFDGFINKYEHIKFEGAFKQNVSINPDREIPVYDINFNIADSSTLVVGGSMIDIKATINEIYGDENFKLSYFISAGSNADNVSSDINKLTINPTASGKIVIGCKAVSHIVGTIEKSISLHIVNPKTDKVELISDDSFHKTGNDLVVKLSIGGMTEFINYKPTWSVKIEDGNNKKDIDFIVDEKGNAVVKAANEGYYLVTVTDSILTSEETTFRVAKVDMQKMAKKYLPLMAFIMIVAIIIVALLKKKILIGKTVANQLKKIDSLIDKRINSHEYNKKHFIRDASIITFRVNNAISIAEELDQKSLGQHQPIISSLQTIKKIIVATLSNRDKMTDEKIKLVLENIKTKHVQPTIKLSNDVNEVMEKFESEKIKNIMVVDPNVNKEDETK